LDTNVLISAVVFGGNPRTIIEAALSHSIELCISEPIVQEFREVLLRPQFGLSPQFVHNVAAELTSTAEWVVPTKHLELVAEDPSDNLVLDCAVEAGAQYLVTGDAHLLRLQNCAGVAIVTPQVFVATLQGSSGQ
jgi:putative PIN family toxin of toxin-antitoxin system